MDNHNEPILSKIYTIRGHKVMLDRDLAVLYRVNTKVLNQSVKRNTNRFPEDFMFQLSSEEFKNWKSQIVTSNSDKMGLRRAPYAFTEHGVAMLSSVLNSHIAVEINIKIMRVFINLRQQIALQPEHAVLNQTIKQIESRMDTLEANHLVDQMQLTGKITHVSRDIYDIRENMAQFSELLDRFQTAHIIVRRPEDGGING